LVAYFQYYKLSKAAKIREKCMVVQPNHAFSVFLTIHEISYNIVNVTKLPKIW
jgi:hypothetical protein